MWLWEHKRTLLTAHPSLQNVCLYEAGDWKLLREYIELER